MKLGLFEESCNVMIIEPVFDLVVFPTDRLDKPPITQ